ncbi:MAG: anti-sigma factor family protein [Nitrospinota bacterium]
MNEDCLALFEKMSEYIDGELDPKLVAFAEKHLRNCTDCGENLELMKKSLTIIKGSFFEQVPNAFQKELREVIRKEHEQNNSK